MGLDMYAFKTTTPISGVDFEPKNIEQFAYWRKHPNLHGWMEALYRSKGGLEEFNGVPVALDLSDIDALEQAVNANTLPETEGFFFGESQPEDKKLDRAFIKKARAVLAEGYYVYYDSWW